MSTREVRAIVDGQAFRLVEVEASTFDGLIPITGLPFYVKHNSDPVEVWPQPMEGVVLEHRSKSEVDQCL